MHCVPPRRWPVRRAGSANAARRGPPTAGLSAAAARDLRTGTWADGGDDAVLPCGRGPI